MAQTCNPAENLIIYSYHDGGILAINVEQNFPNLKKYLEGVIGWGDTAKNAKNSVGLSVGAKKN
jgi:hypothetical protein